MEILARLQTLGENEGENPELEDSDDETMVECEGRHRQHPDWFMDS
jgi:hypothetical protein